MNKSVTYVLAPDNSYYDGFVMRRVTADVGNGQSAVLSETTTGMELDEFQVKNPGIPVDGVKGSTLRSEISHMSDEDLEAMGLKRVGGIERVERTRDEPEVLEPTYTYPYPTGYGWFMLSSGKKAKGRAEATRRQDAIDAGNPDPEDAVFEAETAPASTGGPQLGPPLKDSDKLEK